MNKKQSAFANVSERDKNLLLILLALIFLSVSYFFVFLSNDAKTKEISTKNEQLSQELTRLENMKKNEAEKKKEIEELTDKTKKILVKFPNKMTQEKTIAELVDLEKEGKMTVSSVGFSINEMFYNSAETDATDTATAEQTQTATTEQTSTTDGTENSYVEATPLVAYKSTLTLSYEDTTLEGFKKIVDKVNASENKMAIESVTTSFDAESGNLMGTMNLCLYAVDNSETKYEDPVITDVPVGMKSIFGTLETKKSKK